MLHCYKLPFNKIKSKSFFITAAAVAGHCRSNSYGSVCVVAVAAFVSVKKFKNFWQAQFKVIEQVM